MRAQSINIWQYSRPKGAHPLLATSSTCGMARPHRPHTPGMRMVTAAAVAGHARPPRAAPYATASQPTATPNETAGGVAATLCCREAASQASVAPLEEVRLLGPPPANNDPAATRVWSTVGRAESDGHHLAESSKEAVPPVSARHERLRQAARAVDEELEEAIRRSDGAVTTAA